MNNLPSALRACARAYPDTPAVIGATRTVDFKTFDDLTDRVATALAARGIQKGDRVGLYCINSETFALAYFGIQKAGAVVVPANLLLNPEEVSFIMRDAGVKALIYHTRLKDPVNAFRATLSGLSFYACIGPDKADESDLDWPLFEDSERQPPDIAFDPAEDLAALIYTSGTTGYPKGAMLTHRNLTSNVQSVRQALPLEPGKDAILVVLPMFHAFAATAGMLYPLLHGCTLVPLPRFDPAEVAQTIQRHRIAMFFGVPSMYNVLLRLPDEYIPMFAPLKFCISGGAAMPQEILKAFEARYNKKIYEGDGPTECSPVTCVNPVGGLCKPASVGLPVANVQMKIMDDDGHPCPLGTIGEICVRGPNVMKGYWNLPADTAEAFFGEWFRTGDLGTEDEDGYFYIVDRKKDMVIVNGMNVYPRMIEEVLYKHPAVLEAAVVGEPHRHHGEIPVAYIALKENSPVDAATIRQFCREHLGQHEVPRKVNFMAALPKNAAGKILKRELRRSGEWERGVPPSPPGQANA
ncbi:MAG: long-chain fatty acid--CoA ligase [Spartobacteria bacterium]|nr:long-chain fatty acid--CoA ligase [Spartobacteria bacterium]